MKVNELVHKLKDPFARCWNARDVRDIHQGRQI